MTTVADLFAAYERLTVAAHPSVTDTHDGAVCVTVVGHGWPSTSAAVGRGPDRATARAEALAMLARPLAYLRAVAKALAVRLAAIGYTADARALKGASKCWTAARAAKAAAGTLYLSHPALEADLAHFVECAQGASMKAAQSSRVAS